MCNCVPNLSCVSTQWLQAFGRAMSVAKAVHACKVADNKAKVIKRTESRDLKNTLHAELHYAWQRRDAAYAWRVSRRLAGTKIGPKFRKYSAPQHNCTKSEWQEFLQLPGPEGGVAGTLVPCLPDPPALYAEPSMDHRYCARDDFMGLRSRLAKCKLRNDEGKVNAVARSVYVSL